MLESTQVLWENIGVVFFYYCFRLSSVYKSSELWKLFRAWWFKLHTRFPFWTIDLVDAWYAFQDLCFCSLIQGYMKCWSFFPKILIGLSLYIYLLFLWFIYSSCTISLNLINKVHRCALIRIYVVFWNGTAYI